MATKIANYDPAVTDQSKQELLELAEWLQTKSFTPYLVGGWTVYYHTKRSKRPPATYGQAVYDESRYDDPYGFAPLGSKDIDLVFPNSREKSSFEHYYCWERGYKKMEELTEARIWTKTTLGSNSAEIILDLDVLSTKWKVRGSNVSWKPLLKHRTELSLENNASILAPVKELLLLYKCVAIVERTDKRQEPNQDVQYLDSKIWKDANDVLALHDTGINEGRLTALAKETKLSEVLLQAKRIISENYESYQFGQYAFSRKFLSES